MGLTATEASAVDFLEARDDDGRPQRWRRTAFGLLARQVDDGAAATIRTDGGELVLIVGLYPHDWGAEAWFAVGPAARANLLAGVRLARQLLEAAAGEVAPLEVRAFVRSVAGHRIAAWFGFEKAEDLPSPLPGATPFVRRYPA